MNNIIEFINSAGDKFADFSLPMLVQSAVLVLILLAVDFLLRKKVRAIFRYCIWLLVLVKLVLPPSITSPVGIGNFFGDKLTDIKISQAEEIKDTVAETPTMVYPMIRYPQPELESWEARIGSLENQSQALEIIEQKQTAAAVTISWQGVCFVVWLIACFVMFLLLIQRAVFVLGLMRQSKAITGGLNDLLQSCSKKIGIKKKIILKKSPNATSPAVCGLLRPVILLPDNLLPRLTKKQVETVFLHELVHIKRGDLWVNFLQTILQIVYFYNPFVWLANAIIRRVREQAVDEAVQVALERDATEYPDTLLSVAKISFKRPALSLRLIGVVENKSALKGRIARMLSRPIPKKAKLGIAGLAILIIAAAVLLPMASAGEPKLVIRGTITDSVTGELIAGAKVFDDGYGPEPDWENIKAGEQAKWGALTDANGQYSYLTWPEHHTIKVEADGYEEQKRSLYDNHFTINTKPEEVFDFSLKVEKSLATEDTENTLLRPSGHEGQAEDNQISVGEDEGESGQERIDENLIIPGEGVGEFALGMSKDDLLKSRGEPASVVERREWVDMFYEDICFSIVDDSVKSITVTGPSYKFHNGLTVGSPEKKVIETFGDDYGLYEFDFKNFVTYDEKGLMFEIRNSDKTVMEISIGQISAKTDLHKAAESGQSQTAGLLVDSGNNVNAKTTFGYTPLHLAAKNGHGETCRTLINKEADISATSIFGETALHLAAKEGHSEAVQILIDNGAEVNIKAQAGKTALSFAIENGHSQTAEVLIDNGAKETSAGEDAGGGRTGILEDKIARMQAELQTRKKVWEREGGTVRPQYSFGPVIETTINDNVSVRKDSLIDFDTGKLFSLPEDWLERDTDAMLEWIIESGMDAAGATRATVRGLMCQDMITGVVTNSYWDKLPPAQLAESNLWEIGKAGTPAYMTAKGELPATYIFKTREGGIGILQITGFNDEPRGINIRYKMVETSNMEGEEEKPVTTTISPEERKLIEGLIDQLHRTQAILAYAEKVKETSNLEEKIAEYKAKFAEILKNPPTDPDEGLPKELEKAKQAYGDDWNHVYSQLRSVTGGVILAELLDSQFEPFLRFMTMYSGNITLVPVEYRDNFASSSGINPYNEPDLFWKEYKDEYLRKMFSEATSRLEQLQAQFAIPSEVVETVKSETRKAWHMQGYMFFIDLLSEEKVQQTQKYLDNIEEKLGRYPDWKEIEQEMFKPAKVSTEFQKPAGEDEGERWVEAIEGAEIRLKSAEQIWGSSNWPHPIICLKLQARNNGKRYLHLPESGHWQIEVDGTWYEWIKLPDNRGDLWISSINKLLDFNPGDFHDKLTVDIESNWRRIPDGKEDEYGRRLFSPSGFALSHEDYGEELILKDGIHRIRLAVTCPPSRAGIYTPVRLISNAVEIEISTAEKNAGEDEGEGIPVEVGRIDGVLQEWFKLCREDNIEEAKGLLTEDSAPLEQNLQVTKMILEAIGADRIIPVKVIQFENEVVKGAIVTATAENGFFFMGEPSFITATLQNVESEWLIKGISFSKPADFEETISSVIEKYPEAVIWESESYPGPADTANKLLNERLQAFEQTEWEQLDNAPLKVKDVAGIVRKWISAGLANDMEGFKGFYTADGQRNAERNLSELQRFVFASPELLFSPMIIRKDESRAEVVSHSFVIKVPYPGYDDFTAVLNVELIKTEEKWGILNFSHGELKEVPNSTFKRKYPDAQIWYDESTPEWLRPEQKTGVPIDIEELKGISETVRGDSVFGVKVRAETAEREIFESYFPDSNEGGKALDEWWPTRNEDPEVDRKIFEMVRNGLRKDSQGNLRQNRNQYIRTIASKYIWDTEQQNNEAIELLYYATYDRRLVSDAVYYGLSVVRDKSDKILKRLVELCMADISVGRIVWGTQSSHNEMIEYLKPYLESSEINIKERAEVLERVFKGEIDYGKWVDEQTAERLREGFGDKLEEIKEVLLEGSSSQRREIFEVIQRNRLHLIFDTSFEEPIRKCLRDGDPVVKEKAIQYYGTLFKPGECPDEILEIMDELSKNTDSKVRDAVAVFVGSHWIWGVRPQNPKAIEIMYQLSGDKDRSVSNNAVYYGLSVLENKDEKIIKRLIELAMDGTGDLGRIAWGLGRGADMQVLKELLFSYLTQGGEKAGRAGELYREIFKEEPPGAEQEKEEQKQEVQEVQTADKDSLFLANLIRAAEEGSEVTVPKGTYKIPVFINKTLTLKGEDVDNCIFEVTMNGPAVVIDTKGKGKVTIENLTIKWQLATSDECDHPFAVFVKDTEAYINNCSFIPLGNYQRSPIALKAAGFTNMNVSNCRFEGYNYTVQYGEGTEGTFRDSVVLNSGHQGVTLYDGAKAAIAGNIIAGSEYHGLRSTGGELDVQNNLITNNSRGIYLGNKKATGLITNNLFIGNPEGISSFGDSQVTVKNNVFSDSSFAGIDMRNSCRLMIGSNIFVNNECGIKLIPEDERNNNTVEKNTFWNNEKSVEVPDVTTEQIDADPQFIAPEDGDFTPVNETVLEQRQGLTEAQALKALWHKWQRIKAAVN